MANQPPIPTLSGLSSYSMRKKIEPPKTIIHFLKKAGRKTAMGFPGPLSYNQPCRQPGCPAVQDPRLCAPALRRVCPDNIISSAEFSLLASFVALRELVTAVATSSTAAPLSRHFAFVSRTEPARAFR